MWATIEKLRIWESGVVELVLMRAI
jgi:hypothetical protein